MALERDAVFTTRQMNLAWRRITTGRNLAYKAYQRDAFAGYDAARKQNIAKLQERIHGDWTASRPLRVNMPKPSGLQRTISVLELEDQIVLQCLAQAWERRLRNRRAKLAGKFTFSHIANPPNSEFFLKDWRDGYKSGKAAIESLANQGSKWVSSFDLAAFYDTIDHGTLLRLIGAESDNDGLASDVRQWLSRWAFSDLFPGLAHGLPQGPLASDFLADCFLLPVDEALVANGVDFVRYGDDVHVFATSRVKAQRATLVLERECKALGLLAQGSKSRLHEIRDDEDIEQLMRTFSNRSLVGADGEGVSGDHFHRVLRAGPKAAVGGKPLRVQDRTAFRYAMFRAPKDRRIRDVATRLLANHPEYIDELSAHLLKYSRSKGTTTEVSRLLESEPAHSYVEFRLWSLAERYGVSYESFPLESLARQRLKSIHVDNPARWGAFSYLLAAEESGRPRVSHRIVREHELSIIHAMRNHSDLLMSRPVPASFILSKSPDGGLVAPEALARLGITHASYGLRPSRLPYATQGALREYEFIQRTTAPAYDPIGRLLARQYAIKEVSGWSSLFGNKKTTGVRLLRQANSAFQVDKSRWLRLTNSFNELLVRAIIRRLKQLNLAGGATPIHQQQNPAKPFVPLGSLVKSSKFSRAVPNVANPIAAINTRRNSLPDSHSEDYKTGKETTYLTKRERDDLSLKLKGAYALVALQLDTGKW